MIERTHHMVIAIRLIERLDDKALVECFQNGMSVDEIREELKNMRERGYGYVPATGCGNYGPDGACLGHESHGEDFVRLE